ncbi:hypothetical protein [Sulfurimonas sp.]|uniref:hypothetical protein n=1 Tax=Sulfurimonas sp. TaxID=2022749 RepID=UPI0035698B5C
MNKIITISLALCFSLLASDTPTRTGTFPDKEMKAQNKKIAKLVAKEISSTLPQVIDKYTTLASVKNADTTLVYTFEINTGVKSDEAVQKEDRTRMKQAVTEGVCQSSRKFLEAGINTSYVYVSAKTKTRLFQFDIAQKDCSTSLN